MPRALSVVSRLMLLAAFAATMFAVWFGILLRAAPAGPVHEFRVPDPPDGMGRCLRGECDLIAVSNDGRTVIASSFWRCLLVWKAGAGQEAEKVARDVINPFEKWHAPDGRLLLDVRDVTIPIEAHHNQLMLLRQHTERSLRKNKPFALEVVDLTGRLPDVALPLADGQSDVETAVFSNDGETVAVEYGWVKGAKKRVDVFDSRTGRAKLRLHGEEGPLALSHNGRLLATHNPLARPRNRVVVLWDVETGRQLARLVTETGYLRKLSFSPDSRRLIALTRESQVLSSRPLAGSVWDTDSFEVVATFPRVSELTICSATGDMVVRQPKGDGHSVTVLARDGVPIDGPGRFADDWCQLVEGTRLFASWERPPEPKPSWFECFFGKEHEDASPTTRFLGLGPEYTHPRLVVRDARDGRELLRVLAMNQPVFSANGEYVAVLTFDDQVQVWRTRPRSILMLLVIAAIPALGLTATLGWRFSGSLRLTFSLRSSTRRS